MNPSATRFNLTDQQSHSIEVSISNPTEVKTTLSSFTVYRISGRDSKGDFEATRRYSEFDLVRQALIRRWPGCYVPPLPEKKIVGNSQSNFVENRKHGLEVFLKEVGELPHLWYSDQFQILIRKSGDVEANIKALPNETHEDIIKKYDDKLIHLRGRSIDTNLISKVLQFNKYLRKVQPLLLHFKQFLVFFAETKNNYYDQYSVLLNYVLPEYERTCLSNYLNQNTDSRLIFSDERDERLASFVTKLKQMFARHNFEQLLMQVQHEEREINAFLDVYKQHSVYEKKVGELRDKDKELEIKKQELSMGKQGLLKSFFKKNIEDDKKQNQRDISVNKDFITTYSLLSDLITMLLGFFQIDRFRQTKSSIHQKTIKQIAAIQTQFARLQRELCNHILDNHNLI